MVKVSVIMPVYNAEAYVASAIDSILKQTFTDFEFIILNDGSTDNTKSIVSKFTDKRIKFIDRSENLGIVETLNRGLDLAAGEYIARMDSDDIAMPNRFEEQVKYLDEHQDVGALGTSYIQFGENIPEQTIIKKPHITYLDTILGCPVVHPSVMIRKSVLNKFNLRYRPEYKHAEDYDLWARLIRYSRIDNLTDVLLKYRYHKSNISIVNYTEQSYIAEAISSNMLKFLTDIPEIQLKLKNAVKLTRYYNTACLSSHMMRHHPIRWLRLKRLLKRIEA